jgi:hypothetical protein
METRFDRASGARANLAAALEAYDAVREDLEALRRYYEGGDWRRDFEADEAGRLPEGLKRGVLSEDGLYNLLCDSDALRGRLKDKTQEE